MSKPKSDYTIQTVNNALRLLEAFYEEAELGVSELSRRLGLHKNNVFRLLATLEEEGYVEQSQDNERYRLGLRSLCVLSRLEQVDVRHWHLPGHDAGRDTSHVPA